MNKHTTTDPTSAAKLEIARLRAERDKLREALLDAVTVFEIDISTRFRLAYADLIERAGSKAP